MTQRLAIRERPSTPLVGRQRWSDLLFLHWKVEASVVQATLPDDPAHGFVVIYAFDSALAARGAAEDQAAYIESGIGRVQFAPDAHFVLRVLGSAVVFYWWSPGAALDARAQSVEDALLTVGEAVEVAA